MVGPTAVSAKIDSWGLGLMMLELATCETLDRMPAAALICGQNKEGGGGGGGGNPAKDWFEALENDVLRKNDQWLRRQLGERGRELLHGLLSTDHDKRVEIGSILDHDYFNPCRLKLMKNRRGSTLLHGGRSDFSIVHGVVAAEILHDWQSFFLYLVALAELEFAMN